MASKTVRLTGLALMPMQPVLAATSPARSSIYRAKAVQQQCTRLLELRYAGRTQFHSCRQVVCQHRSPVFGLYSAACGLQLAYSVHGCNNLPQLSAC